MGVVLTGERVLLRGWSEDDLAPFAAAERRPARHGALPGPALAAPSPTRSCATGSSRSSPSSASACGPSRCRASPRSSATWVSWCTRSRPTSRRVSRSAGASRSRTGVTATRPRPRGSRSHTASPRRASRRSCRSPSPRTAARSRSWSGWAWPYAGEFDHPRLPEGHALRRHVLYRLSRSSTSSSNTISPVRSNP